jgi:hypothetical protein
MRAVNTTEYLLVEIANLLRKAAKLPPIVVKPDGEIVIPAADAPKAVKLTDTGAPAPEKPARKKRGRKKKT